MDRAPGLTVRPLRSDEVTLLRELRLRALADAPDAFGESLSTIEAKPAGYWDELARSLTTPGRHVMFVAETESRSAGMAFGIRDTTRDGVGRVAGMWVDPAQRGRGAARRLTEAVLDWARHGGLRRVELSVTEGNDAAQHVYRRCGFVPTGARRPLPSNPARWTIAMARDL